MKTDHEFERLISVAEAQRILHANIDRGNADGSNWVIHLGNKTLFINSETPIEFAVPK